jgi:alpha-beta hydrolase superfamily lysophospholipase
MDAALLSSPRLTMPALVLYGERDEIIPAQPLCEMLADLPVRHPQSWRLVLYPEGYHMLSRDLQASVVLDDMVAWLGSRQAALPSHLEVTTNARRVQVLCGYP